jgi:hypothetical protein
MSVLFINCRIVIGIEKHMDLTNLSNLINPPRKLRYCTKQENAIKKASVLWFTGILFFQILKIVLIFYLLLTMI